MSGNIINASTLEQLKRFLNKDKVLEIVVRQKNGRIKTFQKVSLSDLSQSEDNVLLEKVVSSLCKNNALNEKSIKSIANVAKMEKIGLLLNGVNLCATCAGFTILYAKLESISREINGQLMQLQNVVKKGFDVQAGYEFNKVLADHTDMLDCRRKRKPYSEEKMRVLVDREYNVLQLLISIFREEISANNKEVIYSIFSLLSMLTASMIYFDEIYYENNHETLDNGNVWYTAHDKWMGVYETLRSKWFVEKLQDYGMFETDLNTVEIDAFWTSLLDQVADEQQEVKDNQELIVSLGDIGLLHSLQEITTQDVKNTIKKAFEEACAGDDPDTVTAAYESALKQAAIA